MENRIWAMTAASAVTLGIVLVGSQRNTEPAVEPIALESQATAEAPAVPPANLAPDDAIEDRRLSPVELNAAWYDPPRDARQPARPRRSAQLRQSEPKVKPLRRTSGRFISGSGSSNANPVAGRIRAETRGAALLRKMETDRRQRRNAMRRSRAATRLLNHRVAGLQGKSIFERSRQFARTGSHSRSRSRRLTNSLPGMRVK